MKKAVGKVFKLGLLVLVAAVILRGVYRAAQVRDQSVEDMLVEFFNGLVELFVVGVPAVVDFIGRLISGT